MEAAVIRRHGSGTRARRHGGQVRWASIASGLRPVPHLLGRAGEFTRPPLRCSVAALAPPAANCWSPP